MIETYLLSELLKQYGIDSNKVIKNNDRILDRGEYLDIKYSLDYLIDELHISPKNIEKCPSIMYLNVYAIKSNYNFLVNNHIKVNSIETCLHILSSEHNQLKETFNYVLTNYGIKYINNITSILSIPVDRIKEIESLNLDKYLTLSVSISRRTVDEIEAIIKVCKDNNLPISRTIFLRTADEIEAIIKVCKDNNLPISGTIFLRIADEIKIIIKVCKDNNLPISGSMFGRTADEIEVIIKVCKDNNILITGTIFVKKVKSLIETINYIKDNYNDQYLISLIIIKDVNYIKTVFPYLAEIGVLEYVINSASILSLTLDEIKERKQFIESIGESIVLDNGRFNSIFGLSKKNYQNKIKNSSKKL